MVQCNAGGTFGYKFSPTMEALIGVAVLATGRPATCATTTNSSSNTPKRSPFFTTVRYAADKATGKIKAMEADWIVDHGPYSNSATC
ncbi:MAG: molybdopterin cofactor-binding domain-containing protein [Bilophila wadsworthia]